MENYVQNGILELKISIFQLKSYKPSDVNILYVLENSLVHNMSDEQITN